MLIEPSPDYNINYNQFTGLCTLDICEAFPQDSGQYTCVASNPAGTESSTAYLVVKGSLCSFVIVLFLMAIKINTFLVSFLKKNQNPKKKN